MWVTSSFGKKGVGILEREGIIREVGKGNRREEVLFERGEIELYLLLGLPK